MRKNNRTRKGIPADIYRLDSHDWCGRLINRVKSKTTEKEKGFLMISTIMRDFNIGLAELSNRLRFQEMTDIKEGMEELKRKGLFENQSRSEFGRMSEPLRAWKQ